MQGFVTELRRRNVLRAAALYAAAGWVLVQVATQVFPFFDIPNSVVRLVVVAIVLGFPVAMLLSWFYELTPEGLKPEREVDRADPQVRAAGRRMDRWIIAALGLAVVLLLADRLVPRKPALTAAVNDKSIAVLPFENLSDDKANAYFAEGIQDEILTKLAKVGALKVISRSSTQQYAAKPANLMEVGRQLGVANVLEGSVQKAGDRVHINVQLIRAATDDHLWAESYDRKLDDVFGVQGEVAQAIAQALQAQLSGGEQLALNAKPTEDSAAYEAYLRGLGGEARARTTFSQQDFAAAEHDYAEAVRLDPAFALAWAHLAIVRSYLYDGQPVRSAETLAEARQAADTALALQPEMGESYLAQGFYHYRGLRDYAGGLQFFNQALQRLPNSATARAAISYIERRQGHWPEAIAHLDQALQLDPLNTGMLVAQAENHRALRQYDQAFELYDRALQLVPRDPDLIAAKAEAYQDTGRLDEAGKLLAGLPFDPARPASFQIHIKQFLYQRRFDLAIPPLDAAVASTDPAVQAKLPGFSFFLGFVQLWSGNRDAAYAVCSRALQQLDAMRKSDDDDATLGSEYAGVYGCLGDYPRALHYAQRAIELNADDALVLPSLQTLQAMVQAQGDRDAAIAALPKLLQEPGGLTVPQLQLPFWDPLRQDPRFQKLLQQPGP